MSLQLYVTPMHGMDSRWVLVLRRWYWSLTKGDARDDNKKGREAMREPKASPLHFCWSA
ncbi:hypothetical protein TSMEX_004760 [Taenia solium]|eukprot:TsM_000374000 transcript=TsM_000374000 gene=TsM_000374000